MSHQKWIRWESERFIIDTLSEGDRSFTDLTDLTGLSKPVLSQRLKRLKMQGKIEIVPEMETKRFLYRLIRENLDALDELHTKLHLLSKIITAYMIGFAKDLSLTDEEYSIELRKGISMLFNLKMLSYMVAPPELGEQWLKNTLGLEFVSKLSQLFPNNRDVIKYYAKSIPLTKLTILPADNIEEAVQEINASLDNIIEKVTKGNSASEENPKVNDG